MKTIWRYDLLAEDDVPLEVPAGATFLQHVVASDRVSNGFTVWVEVDTDAPFVERVLHVYGTGNPKPPGGRYLATYRLGGMLWFHVFEEEATLIRSLDGSVVREDRG